MPPRGEAHIRAKLTDQAVREILDLLAIGMTCDYIGAQYGVTRMAISAIKCGRSWAHVPRIPGRHAFRKRAKLTEGEVRAILDLLKSGATQRVIARQFGVSKEAIRAIKCGKNWKHVPR